MGRALSASLIGSERYFLTCYGKIELNPVREATVEHPGDYGWSSHGAHAHGKPGRLITDHEKYLALGKTPGERQHAYRELFRRHLDPDATH